MVSQKNKNSNLHKIFLNLAFEKAKINLGKTKLNPTVGCVLVKNNSVISSGYTSIGGRPHAEYNALRFKKKFDQHILCNYYMVNIKITHNYYRKYISKNN